MVDMWKKARFICFLFVLVGGLISSLQIALLPSRLNELLRVAPLKKVWFEDSDFLFKFIS